MQALLDKLNNIDVDARIAELKAYIDANKHKGPDKVDKQVKALKVLLALKDQGLTPYEAFTRETVPVIPSQYRAPIQLPNNTFIVPDVNDLLRNIGFMATSLADVKDELPADELEKARKDLYGAVDKLQGLETPEINRQIKKNYFATISGSPGPAKSGFVQTSLTKKRVDLSGRSVISPNPQLDMDQVEIPIDMGLSLYKPFVKRELINRGYSPDKANKLISSKDERALDALQRAGDTRPVLINRAPSIDQGSVTAHWPTFVDKYNINIPNVIAQYQKGDFDGDTVSVHVPVSQGAVEEATRMMPSLNMYNDASDKIRAFPDHSAAAGLYIISKTSQGQKAINDILPKEYRIHGPIIKPQLVNILTGIAKTDSRAASVIVDNLVRLGNDFAYTTGMSYGLSDLEPLREARDVIMKDIKRDIKSLKHKTPDALRSLYKEYADKASDLLNEYYKDKDNPMGDILISRARGSASQVRDAIFSPIAVNSQEVIPKPIKHSFIEGLTPSEYFSSAAGARLGLLGKVQGTANPGALGKVVFSNANTLVVNKDKGESMGSIMLPVSNPIDLVDRYASRDVYAGNKLIVEKDTVITPRIVQMATKHGLTEMPVYTPLMSSSADGGIPAMSYGIIKGNQLPEVGYNIGAHSAAGLVAPLYTESMQSFHTGKSLQDRNAGYPRLKQVLELTKSIQDKATVATVTGIVSDIRRDALGGHNVIINGVDHYINPSNKVNVEVGMNISSGDPLSDGPIDPRDIAKHKDLPSAQKYMVDEIVKNTPTNIKRRSAEVLVEAITRYGQVVDPGSSEYLPGDVKLVSEIEHRNKELANKIKYEPYFKGVTSLPLSSQSWMSQLNFRNIKKSLSKAIATGASSDVHSYEPSPGLIMGTEFGDGDDGRY